MDIALQAHENASWKRCAAHFEYYAILTTGVMGVEIKSLLDLAGASDGAFLCWWNFRGHEKSSLQT